MPLISEFNPKKIKQLHSDFEAILDELSKSLETLEKATMKFKANFNDKTSTEAIQIVNEYKRIIKKIQETAAESITAVKEASDKFNYIEDVLASRLSER